MDYLKAPGKEQTLSTVALLNPDELKPFMTKLRLSASLSSMHQYQAVVLANNSQLSYILGVYGARNGTLTFMVGGKQEKCDLHRNLLEKMGKSIVCCGSPGAGQIAKICNNLLLAVSMAGLCEVLVLGKRLGLNAEILSQIINSSSGRCWSSEVNNPIPGLPSSGPSNNDYVGGFSTKLLCKDTGIALSAAEEVGFVPKVGSEVNCLFQEICSDKNYSDKDFSSLYQFLASK